MPDTQADACLHMSPDTGTGLCHCMRPDARTAGSGPMAKTDSGAHIANTGHQAGADLEAGRACAHTRRRALAPLAPPSPGGDAPRPASPEDRSRHRADADTDPGAQSRLPTPGPTLARAVYPTLLKMPAPTVEPTAEAGACARPHTGTDACARSTSGAGPDARAGVGEGVRRPRPASSTAKDIRGRDLTEPARGVAATVMTPTVCNYYTATLQLRVATMRGLASCLLSLA